MRMRLGTLLVCLAATCTGLRATAQDAATALGTITGIVLDASSGDPIIEAGVEVMGAGKKTRTDLDGKYIIKIAPGKYEVRVFAPLYQGTRLQNVVVAADQPTTANASLRPEGDAAVEVVEVVAEADKAAEATQMVVRQKSSVVSDNIGAETIQKSTDSDAGEIVTRVPAVVVKDDKYINVRGLNERYTGALLNDSRLPSTDPERRVVPLDLFPADFIESISLVKSYSPELPGDFAGGLAKIDLKDFPDQATLGFSISTGSNTNILSNKFNSYRGAGTADLFGFGDHFRRLPDGVPDNANDVNRTPARRQAFGRSFDNIWDVNSRSAPPNWGMAFNAGNTYGPLGVSLGATYNNEYKLRPNALERQYKNQGSPQEPEIILADELNYAQSTYETRIGSLLTSGYKIDPNHRLSFRALYNRNTYDEVVFGSGPEDSQALIVDITRLRYTVDQLAFGQLGGEHHFSWIDTDWRTAFARTTQDQPDGRFVARNNDPATGENIFSNDNFSGRRVFGELEERMTDSGVDFTVPFKTQLPGTDVWSGLPAKLKFGPAYTRRQRDQSLRQLLFDARRSGFDLTLPTETLLAPENIGPLADQTGILFSEVSQPRDSFSASQEIAGLYGMFELPILAGRPSEGGGLVHQLRLIAGMREEYSYIRVHTKDNTGNTATTIKNDLDPLPALNLIYNPRSDTNLRFSFSQTVTRPDFRELSPVQYPAPGALRTKAGNPDLVEVKIDSFDLRWEWFVTPAGELISLSAFFKQLDQPIEQIVSTEGSNAIDTFVNADKAEVLGIELETRANLGRLHDRLRPFNFLTNVTWADSEVTVPQAGPDAVTTNSNRQLQGQAPFVVNAALDFEPSDDRTVRLSYNTVGRRIESAGAFGLPDNFEERRDQLDFVLLAKINPFETPNPLTAKIGFENLLNDNYVFTQGDDLQKRYRTGVKFSVGFSYAF